MAVQLPAARYVFAKVLKSWHTPIGAGGGLAGSGGGGGGGGSGLAMGEGLAVPEHLLLEAPQAIR